MSLRLPAHDCAFVHLTLVPYINSAGELKTKPTQHSVQKLREIGIMPTTLLCRADRQIPEDERAKISLFSNVREEAVISVWDVDTIYKIPEMLHAQGMDDLICRELELKAKPADLSVWANLVYEMANPQHEVTIGMVGKYVELTESYKSLIEALRHAGIHTHTRVNINYIDSEDIEKMVLDVCGIWMRFWFRVALASVVQKARLLLFVMPARTMFLIWAFALECNWLSLNLHAMLPI